MGRMNLLSVRKVEQFKERKTHADGNGLYLRVTNENSKSWSFVWHEDGRRREMGLGSATAGKVGLAEAREKAEQVRRDLKAGINPKLEKVPLEPKPTFGEIADAYIEDRKALILPRISGRG